MAWDSVYNDRRDIALYQRTHVVEEFLGYVSALFVYPVSRDELFIICYFVYVFDLCAALIWVIGEPLQDDHFAGVAFICSFYRRTAYLISFQNIYSG